MNNWILICLCLELLDLVVDLKSLVILCLGMYVVMIFIDIRFFGFYDLFCYIFCNFFSLSENFFVNKRIIYRLFFLFRFDYYLSC